MSPTSLTPGASAVKSRATRSAVTAAASSGVVVARYGRGWQATSPCSRMIDRTTSTPASTPWRAS